MDISQLTIAAAVNNDLVLRQNLLASPVVRESKIAIVVRRNFVCAGRALNSALDTAGKEHIVICTHQDVYLPQGWEYRLLTCIQDLEKRGEPWAVLGAYGATADGHRSGRVWSTGLGFEVRGERKTPTEIVSLDEVLLVLKADSGVRFDDGLPGFHLYGTDVVLQARSQGKKAFVIDVPVIHNSLPVRYLGKDYWKAYLYCRKKWIRRLPIPTTVVPISRYAGGLFKHNLGSVRQAIRGERSRLKRLDTPWDLATRLGYDWPSYEWGVSAPSD